MIANSKITAIGLAIESISLPNPKALNHKVTGIEAAKATEVVIASMAFLFHRFWPPTMVMPIQNTAKISVNKIKKMVVSA